MACMCGDLCCWSCGPAQGNYKCPICGEWASEGCEHFDDDGRLKREFEAQAAENARRDAEADDAMARELAESDRLAELYTAEGLAAESVHWRERAHKAEAEVKRLQRGLRRISTEACAPLDDSAHTVSLIDILVDELLDGKDVG